MALFLKGVVDCVTAVTVAVASIFISSFIAESSWLPALFDLTVIDMGTGLLLVLTGVLVADEDPVDDVDKEAPDTVELEDEADDVEDVDEDGEDEDDVEEVVIKGGGGLSGDEAIKLALLIALCG